MSIATPEDVSKLLDLIAELRDHNRALLAALKRLRDAASAFVAIADRDTHICNNLKMRLAEATLIANADDRTGD